MARQNIATGSAANDGTGDTLRSAGGKINDNFVELYLKLGGDSDALSDQLSMTVGSLVFEGSAADAHETFLQVVNPTADRIVYVPNAGGTLILDSDTQTMTNKTLTSPVLTTPQINDTSSNHQYVVAVSELAADRTITLPLLTAGDTFLFATHAATLENKTLTSPVVNTPKIGTSINDTNGAELLKLTAASSAVNEYTLANAASGNKPTLSATGGDTNITTKLSAKGSGSVEVTKGAVTATTRTANGAATPNTGYIICNKGSALAVSLANGTVVGETKLFTNKGAGTATITPANLAGGTTVTIQTHEAAHLIWDGTNWFLIASFNGALA
tara:strand:- start:977 stop:1963 length:987 start_codon:yes stop_codon:yes gene_type:complete